MWWALHQVITVLVNGLADMGGTLGATSLGGGLARLFLLTLLGLLGIGVCWALFLLAARSVMGRLRSAHDFASREPDVGPALQRRGVAFAGRDREEPSIGGGHATQDLPPAPAAAAYAAHGLDTQEPAHRALPIRHVRLARLPRPAPLGAVKGARPEWTGAVVPTSLEEAGAVEVARILVRHESAGKNRKSVRAVDYRISSLPRVDAAGQRRPNMLVYTALDRGFVPKASRAPLRFKL
jgi:hypothetical protein